MVVKLVATQLFIPPNQYTDIVGNPVLGHRINDTQSSFKNDLDTISLLIDSVQSVKVTAGNGDTSLFLIGLRERNNPLTFAKFIPQRLLFLKLIFVNNYFKIFMKYDGNQIKVDIGVNSGLKYWYKLDDLETAEVNYETFGDKSTHGDFKSGVNEIISSKVKLRMPTRDNLPDDVKVIETYNLDDDDKPND